jgi:hypothetical protein
MDTIASIYRGFQRFLFGMPRTAVTRDSADRKQTLFPAVNVPNGPNRLGPLGSDGLED